MVHADLHIHSCLSPCGSDEMSPFDLVGIAMLNGLDLIALTDHNSSKNCPAAAAAAAEYGIGFIPGMEATTSEDIHCVCLFPSLDAASAFDLEWEDHIFRIPNRPDRFGEQTIVRADGSTDTYPWLLIAASDVSVIDLPDLVRSFGGICYPAHVDREANGLLAILGAWPEELHTEAAEIRFELPEGLPEGLKIIRSSDAHRIADIATEGCPLDLSSPDFDGLNKYQGI